MDSPAGGAGDLEDLSASEGMTSMPAVTSASGADPGDEPRPRDAPDVALVERSRPDEVTFAKQVGVFAGTLMFALGLLVPVVVLLWGALSIGASAMAGTALLHTRGLEPKTFGTALVVGLVVAGGLLIWASLAAAVSAEPVVAPSGRVRPARTRPVGHPFLGAMVALLAASLLMTLAASTHSPFFPYPFATIVLVATVTFIAVVSLVVAFRVVRRLWIVTFDWACHGHYRAGFVTACLLMLGLAGAWAQRAGWTARPIRWAWSEAELDDVHGPTGVVDAGEKLLCLGAGELEPRLARSASAPVCSFLPGVGAGSRRDQCFETLMARSYGKVVRIVASGTSSMADAEDLVVDAMLVTCLRSELPDNPEGFLITVASNAAKHLGVRRGREIPCDDLERVAAAACRPDDTVELRESKMARLTHETMCRLRPREKEVAELYLHGRRFREIDQALGLKSGKAKNTFNYAMDRLKPELEDVLEACRIE